jgi:hypothetical protein
MGAAVDANRMQTNGGCLQWHRPRGRDLMIWKTRWAVALAFLMARFA